MKQFTGSIQMTVSVDAIAKNLAEVIKDDYKHKDLNIETIIEAMKEKEILGYLHNSLNGYTNEIDFKVGDIVDAQDGSVSIYKDGSHIGYRTIGKCKVVGINLYATKKLTVEYEWSNREDNLRTSTDAVDHTLCTHIPEEPVVAQVEELAVAEVV